MFGWLTERRRRHLRERPFPDAWRAHLAANVAIAARLDAEHAARLRDLIQVFIAEKRWEGCGGLELTEEIQVTIAGLACVMLLGRDHDLYADVESILVYPDTMVLPPRQHGFFEAGARVDAPDAPILGQAFLHGPVILAWDDVLDGGRERRPGHNVVFHELAHKIDMLDGAIDGTPPLRTAAARRAWAAVCEAAFLALRDRAAAGEASFLDDYGATNEAEFFAVATEAYFTRPRQMRGELPALHALLADYYRFEPPANGDE